MTNEEIAEKVLPRINYDPNRIVDECREDLSQALDLGDLIPRERLMTHEKIKQTINTCVCEALHQSWSDDSLVSAIADDLVGKVAVKEEALLTLEEVINEIHKWNSQNRNGEYVASSGSLAEFIHSAMLKKARGEK